MNKVILVCNSITSAQKIMRFISKSGFWCGIDRTPISIRKKTCSYSVTIYEKDFLYINNLLEKYNTTYLSAFLYANNEFKPFGGVYDIF